MKTTGWPPGLLQDDCRGLSKWFASKLDAKRIVRQVAKEIIQQKAAHDSENKDSPTGTDRSHVGCSATKTSSNQA